jgi:hypothetical protein
MNASLIAKLNSAAKLLKVVDVDSLVAATECTVEEAETFIAALNTASSKPAESAFKPADSFEGSSIEIYRENGGTDRFADIRRAMAARDIEKLMSFSKEELDDFKVNGGQAPAAGLELRVRRDSKGNLECGLKGVKGRPTTIRPFVGAILMACDAEGLFTGESDVKAYNNAVGIGMPTIHSLSHFNALCRAIRGDAPDAIEKAK